MGHSYTNLLYHIVFSTKDHRPFIGPTIAERLYGYLGGGIRGGGVRVGEQFPPPPLGACDLG